MHNPRIEVARRIAESSWETVNGAIGDEAVRALVNWLGCALAGARDAYLEAIPDNVAAIVRGAEATVLGLGDRVDLTTAAAITATGADELSYIDTHVPTLLAPAAVVGGALLPLAEYRDASGAAFVHAFALGTEFACRTALALGSPASQGSSEAVLCNAIGAAAACANLLHLDAERTAQALDSACDTIEAEDANRAGRWSGDAAGFAAKSGLLAALHAESLERNGPLEHTSSPLGELMARSGAFLDGWGSRWEIGRLAYHAYPCALFLHPAVEVCLQLKRNQHLTARQIGAVQVRMHPSQVALDPGIEPTSTQAARQSIQHAVAAALLDGEVGPSQFEATKLRNARMQELRARVEVVADTSIAQTGALVVIEQPGVPTLEHAIRCALGHPLRPLGDRELSDKFRGLCTGLLATGQSERLLGLLWNVRALPDVGGLIRATIPEEVYEPTDLPGSPLIPR